MNKTISCGKCQTDNPDTHSFCLRCGASLESVGIREEEPFKLRSGYNQMIQILGSLGAVVIIAVMILIALVTTRHSTPNTPQNTSESTETVSVPEPAPVIVTQPTLAGTWRGGCVHEYDVTLFLSDDGTGIVQMSGLAGWSNNIRWSVSGDFLQIELLNWRWEDKTNAFSGKFQLQGNNLSVAHGWGPAVYTRQ